MASTRELLDFATEAAWQAGRGTLEHFQARVDVERKPDDSPVTIADRTAEQILRRLIEERFPRHAIVGEELGHAPDKDSSCRWILDPIDGTQSFIRGVPLYGMLVALEVSGEMLLGVAYFPALGEMFAAAAGEGCRWNGRPSRVSRVSRLDEALLAYTDARDLVETRADAWSRLQKETRLQRGFPDCYGHCLVASGRAEVMLDAYMSAWDCAALLPILREAGGTCTDWTGKATIDGGNAFSTNGLLFNPVLEILTSRR